jgi:hypothetical protein
MKALLAAALAALVCAACAQGGASVPDSGSGSIEMYGTIDKGVTFKN